MPEVLPVLAILLTLFLLLGFGVWIGTVLLGTGVVTVALYSQIKFGAPMATTVWSNLSPWGLTSLPLFIWMGEILFRSNLSVSLFEGLSPILRRLPGGLLHVNIAGCSTFAAISGSSAATLATVGKMTIPQLRARGYPESMTLGTLAGASTLGLLIPPSINMIVYGVVVDESIGRLFIAGIIPGIVLSLLFAGYVFAWGVFSEQGLKMREQTASLREIGRGMVKVTPVILLIGGITGSIFFGFAVPTEAAAVGVIGALIVSASQGTLTTESFMRSLLGAVATTSMVMLLLVGSSFLNFGMSLSGLPGTLADWIGGFNLSALGLISCLMVLYLVLGMFLDGFSMILLTMVVVEPMVRNAGIDLIWFGVFMVIVGEMALITPPIGFNLFMIQGITGKDIGFVARAALPMFLLMLVCLFLLVAFPQMALWLPEYMTR
ncbi:MAG: TRAP transporter large permease subunit [Albidovulum sp.]|nr:TRAP transporter large permease subunit [Albidovulum sp.]